jgi:quinol monooxygenase YgiN
MSGEDACSHAALLEARSPTLRSLPNYPAGFAPIFAPSQNRGGRAMKKAAYTPADLNDGFVVAIMIEAKPGEADAVAEIGQKLIAPTLAEPGVKLFIPYRSPINPALFFIYELYVDEAAWVRTSRRHTSRSWSPTCCRG